MYSAKAFVMSTFLGMVRGRVETDVESGTAKVPRSSSRQSIVS